MKRMRKRVTAFMLAIVMLFTTGCSSGFYADELSSVDSVKTEKKEFNQGDIPIKCY